MNQKTYWAGFAAAIIGGIAIPAIIDIWSPTKKIPADREVQAGYLVPSKLEIELQDLDGNGQKETILKYDGKSYLFSLDEQGKPRVQAYEAKTAEVVPRQ